MARQSAPGGPYGSFQSQSFSSIFFLFFSFLLCNHRPMENGTFFFIQDDDVPSSIFLSLWLFFFFRRLRCKRHHFTKIQYVGRREIAVVITNARKSHTSRRCDANRLSDKDFGVRRLRALTTRIVGTLTFVKDHQEVGVLASRSLLASRQLLILDRRA